MQRRSTVLFVMPQERCSRLIEQVKRDIGATVRLVPGCLEAATLLRDDADVRLVLTDLCLPDGTWFDVLNLVGVMDPGARVVVCAPVADELLWVKVLEAGGFDVLVEPYEEREVHRILTVALKAHHPRWWAIASEPKASAA